MQALFYLSRQHHAENPLRLITLAQAEGFQGQELFHESVQCSAVQCNNQDSTGQHCVRTGALNRIDNLSVHHGQLRSGL